MLRNWMVMVSFIYFRIRSVRPRPWLGEGHKYLVSAMADARAVLALGAISINAFGGGGGGGGRRVIWWPSMDHFHSNAVCRQWLSCGN